MRINEQEDRRAVGLKDSVTGGHGDKGTKRQEDMSSGRLNDRKSAGQEDRGTVGQKYERI
jgi:hypothetical protein